MKSQSLILTTAIGAALLSACAVAPQRYITHTVSAPETVYISYAEVSGTNYFIGTSLETKSHLIRCRIARTNEVTCEPETAIGTLLNPPE